MFQTASWLRRMRAAWALRRLTKLVQQKQTTLRPPVHCDRDLPAGWTPNPRSIIQGGLSLVGRVFGSAQ